uniref:Core Histone H2A/H2B/H3 domain-containing protein n=2 Tax=Latimeria chalumnae TaxID=7897 RepID=H3AK44_LATCH
MKCPLDPVEGRVAVATKGKVAKRILKHKRKKKARYSAFIYRVSKQVHPPIGISKMVMNSFVGDLFDRLAAEAARLALYNKRCAITSREVQTAVRILLPGEMAKHA